MFDREPFDGTIGVDSLDRCKRRRIDHVTKKVRIDAKPIEDDGNPRPEFVFENDLNADGKPHELFEPFLPRSLTGMWTLCTNHKALLESAG